MIKKILTTLAIIFLTTSSFAYRVGDKVVLVSSSNCPACQESKALLKSHNIPFTTASPSQYHAWLIPQLYVNGKYMGTGTDAVEAYVNS